MTVCKILTLKHRSVVLPYRFLSIILTFQHHETTLSGVQCRTYCISLEIPFPVKNIKHRSHRCTHFGPGLQGQRSLNLQCDPWNCILLYLYGKLPMGQKDSSVAWATPTGCIQMFHIKQNSIRVGNYHTRQNSDHKKADIKFCDAQFSIQLTNFHSLSHKAKERTYATSLKKYQRNFYFLYIQ